ncbi:hypothetical protein F2P81_022593 [Scophthalmus maximus]|uniref:Uncharacterized protein n=1 Tax=Scophthalmus maximus TaxID=52904 RepID=A0A6A4S306_SCOMX|nr:hypothetical protein F2P81_022593 [Scophthalmus maximus]
MKAFNTRPRVSEALEDGGGREIGCSHQVSKIHNKTESADAKQENPVVFSDVHRAAYLLRVVVTCGGRSHVGGAVRRAAAPVPRADVRCAANPPRRGVRLGCEGATSARGLDLSSRSFNFGGPRRESVASRWKSPVKIHSSYMKCFLSIRKADMTQPVEQLPVFSWNC